ncbi:MAG: hypothetical protein ABIT37_13580 [Luteolibacter sp.]
MRGSPLIRFILLTIALIATGMGLQRVTSARMTADAPVAPVMLRPVTTALVPFRLVLSAPAGEVKIDTGKALPVLPTDVSPIIGNLELDEANPHVSLIVRWKNPAAAGEHRFAKLTLEAPGQDTFTHVFDADGDIDDFLELPLPAAK